MNIQQFAHFASALADQAEHDDIRLCATHDRCQQHRLACARFAEYTHPLAAGDGDQAIDRADAQRQRLLDNLPRKRRWRLGVDRIARQRHLGVVLMLRCVQKVTDRIDHAAEQCIADRRAQPFAGRNHFGLRGHALQFADGGKNGFFCVETHHFGGDKAIGERIAQIAQLANTDRGDRRVHHQSADTTDAPAHRPRVCVAQSFVELVDQRISHSRRRDISRGHAAAEVMRRCPLAAAARYAGCRAANPGRRR